eukprot:6174962-Pleurochrysis_carterae.AAC.1
MERTRTIAAHVVAAPSSSVADLWQSALSHARMYRRGRTSVEKQARSEACSVSNGSLGKDASSASDAAAVMARPGERANRQVHLRQATGCNRTS